MARALGGAPLSSPGRAAPLPVAERAAVLDVLRGFALFGVLVSNLQLIVAPLPRTDLDGLVDQGPLDAVVSTLVAVLVTAKFYPVLALLFGMGLALQLDRVEGRGPVLRRLAVLLGIGVLHALFVWYGDILVTYALLGAIVVLGFRRRTPRTQARWSVVLLVGPALLLGGAVGGLELARMGVPELDAEIAALDAADDAAVEAENARLAALYEGGSYGDVLADRVAAAPAVMAAVVLSGLFAVLPTMLVGVLVVRRGLPFDLDGHRRLLVAVRRWGLRLGLFANVVLVALLHVVGPIAEYGLAFGLLPLVGTTLAFGYAATLALATRDPRRSPRLAFLAPVGRLALTNYLLQSIACTTLAYGYGLGLYGDVGAAAQLALATVLFGVQVLLSSWWLARFRLGPAEWVWRSLAYGRRQSFRGAG